MTNWYSKMRCAAVVKDPGAWYVDIGHDPYWMDVDMWFMDDSGRLHTREVVPDEVEYHHEWDEFNRSPGWLAFGRYVEDANTATCLFNNDHEQYGDVAENPKARSSVIGTLSKAFKDPKIMVWA